MDMSIVVPTYNRRAVVLRTLQSLFAQDCPGARLEIIVVVDGSTDGTATALRALKPAQAFRVVEQENRGPSGARNAGLRVAKAPLVLFLDDDMRCDSGLVRAHLRSHQENPGSVGFGALFLSPDRFRNLASECFNQEIGAFHLRHRHAHSEEWKVTDCVFSNSSIARDTLISLGGFDENLRMREDLELGIRLIEGGVVAKYIPEAIAYQWYGKTSADLIRDAEAFGVADVQVARLHPNAAFSDQVTALHDEPLVKKMVHCAAAKVPALVDALLAPICWFCEVLIQYDVARKIGVRALQVRRRVHWQHKVERELRVVERA